MLKKANNTIFLWAAIGIIRKEFEVYKKLVEGIFGCISMRSK